MKRLLYLIALGLIISSCGASLTRSSQYPGMYTEQPVTILVMPPINNTPNVEAKDLLYTSISRPLIEAGYYVISPSLSMEILKTESAYDSELFVDRPLTPFKDFFGADAVVFSQIDTWTKKGFGIETKIRYFIKSTTTGEIIFDRSCDLYLDLSTNISGAGPFSALAGLAISAANTAITKHISAARKTNYFIFSDIPRGKYAEEYMKDMETRAEKKDIKRRIK